MLSIGHRGCAGQYPENTIHAITASAPHVDAVEIDVLRCGSGELVLFHDEGLGRVTGHDGRLAETPWERLADLRVGGSDEPIPRFAAAVAAWPEGLAMNLDVHEPGIAPDALAELADFDERVILSSTSEAVLHEASEAPVPVESGLSFYEDPERNVGRAAELGCAFVHVHYRLALETDLVERAHEAGLAVDAWTVEDAPTLARLREAGVDAATVDRWDILPGADG